MEGAVLRDNVQRGTTSDKTHMHRSIRRHELTGRVRMTSGSHVAAGIQGHTRGILIVILGVLILTPDGLLTTLVAADIWTMLFWRGLLMALAFTVWRLSRSWRRAIATAPSR